MKSYAAIAKQHYERRRDYEARTSGRKLPKWGKLTCAERDMIIEECKAKGANRAITVITKAQPIPENVVLARETALHLCRELLLNGSGGRTEWEELRSAAHITLARSEALSGLLADVTREVATDAIAALKAMERRASKHGAYRFAGGEVEAITQMTMLYADLSASSTTGQMFAAIKRAAVLMLGEGGGDDLVLKVPAPWERVAA